MRVSRDVTNDQFFWNFFKFFRSQKTDSGGIRPDWWGVCAEICVPEIRSFTFMNYSVDLFKSV